MTTITGTDGTQAREDAPRNGASAAMNSNRPTAREIHDRALADGRSELDRGTTALAVSGLVAGLLMGLSGLGVAALLAELGTSTAAKAVAMLLYPLGFIAVIIGRAQLFTENTLYPVIVVLEERSAIRPMLRMWGAVLAANLFGTLLFALLVTKTGAVEQPAVTELATLGEEAVAGDWFSLFFSGVIGGWLVALVAWLVLAADATMSRIALIFALTYLVGVGSFEHSVATTAEILSAALETSLPIGDFFRWLSAAVLGNVVGGVFIVTLLNRGQVVSEVPNGRERG